MKLAHNIGLIRHSNYNTRQQIIRCNDSIGFDGIYKTVYNNQDCLEGKRGIMFVMGDYIGKDNSFDLKHVPRLEEYCNMEEVRELCEEYDFELGWHTWSHPDLTLLTEKEIIHEIDPPFECKHFAYPYGKFNDTVLKCVKRVADWVGYEDAYSVIQGSRDPNEEDHKWKIFRNYIK